MADPRVQIDLVGVQGFSAAQKRMTESKAAFLMAPRSEIAAAAQILRDALYTAAPKKTGKMARSIAFTLLEEGPAAAAQFTADKVAMFVIEGTKPHDIWAGFYTGKSDKKTLHFVGGDGSEVFTPHVRHPGTKPNDFRKAAWAASRLAIQAHLRQTGNAIVRGQMIRELGVGL